MNDTTITIDAAKLLETLQYIEDEAGIIIGEEGVQIHNNDLASGLVVHSHNDPNTIDTEGVAKVAKVITNNIVAFTPKDVKEFASAIQQPLLQHALVEETLRTLFVGLDINATIKLNIPAYITGDQDYESIIKLQKKA